LTKGKLSNGKKIAIEGITPLKVTYLTAKIPRNSQPSQWMSVILSRPSSRRAPERSALRNLPGSVGLEATIQRVMFGRDSHLPGRQRIFDSLAGAAPRAVAFEQLYGSKITRTGVAPRRGRADRLAVNLLVDRQVDYFKVMLGQFDIRFEPQAEELCLGRQPREQGDDQNERLTR
jgi:hypothetical protein